MKTHPPAHPPAAADDLARGCAQLGLDISAAQAAQLRAHLQILARWNRVYNLTAITKPDIMITHHALDSLSIMKFVTGRNVLDIGSGGGFPGVPLAIAQPRLQVTLLDSRGKRVRFLHNLIGELGLRNAQVAHTRVEDHRPAVKFDTIVVRAFASLAYTWQTAAALLVRGGRLLAMQGKAPQAEIARLQPTLRKPIRMEKLQVPFLAAERNLIIIEN